MTIARHIRGFSDSNVSDGCTYAHEAKHILVNGGPCGSDGPPPLSSTTSTPPGSSPTSSSPPGSFPTGTVPQWGQCGGQGYNGPTGCQAPYTCKKSSEWWSSCQ